MSVTAETSTDAATTLSRMKLTGRVGPVTIYLVKMLFRMLFSSADRVMIRVRIRFNFQLVTGFARIFILPSVVIVTVPW